MIYTLTLNPSLDYIIYTDNYREGKVNRTVSESLVPGGKGINVSRVLKNLGCESIALGFVGGFVGAEIERLLAADGIRTDFVRADGNSRINVKLKAEVETEINARGPQIDISLLYKKLDAVRDGDFLVLAGNAPDKGMYEDIMRRVGKGVKVIADAEGELLMSTLSHKPFLVKPNHHELGGVLGREIVTYADAVEGAGILREMGAQNVFVSMADKGGVLMSADGVYTSEAPKGKVVNSTGAGDSAVAGFIAGYLASGDVGEAFKTGICAGSASAFSHGFATREEIGKLMEEINVSRA